MPPTPTKGNDEAQYFTYLVAHVVDHFLRGQEIWKRWYDLHRGCSSPGRGLVWGSGEQQ